MSEPGSDGTKKEAGTGSELGEGLKQLRADAQLPPPDGEELQACDFWTGLPLDDLAVRLADLLKHSDGRWGIFRMGDEIVRIDPVTRLPKKVTANWFRTWLPKGRNVVPYKSKKAELDPNTGREVLRYIKDGLTKDQAEAVLEPGGALWLKLPVITAINPVPLPIWGEGLDERGLRPIRLLKPGYDPASGILTLGDVHDLDGIGFYDREMDLEDALNHLLITFQEFGWRNAKRDLPIHLAAAVTMFCRGLYVGKAPMFVYNANQQNSGKSRLAQWVTWLVAGGFATEGLLEDKDEALKQDLNAAARSLATYLIFDNVDWGTHEVKSAVLDDWLTQSERSMRGMNTQAKLVVPVGAVTLMTGNNLKLSTDLARRSLIVDIINRVPGSEKVLRPTTPVICERYFANDENRKKGLAAIWAMVREWDKAGQPKHAGKPLDSFEDWGELVPGIILHAGSVVPLGWDCMLPSSNADIGDVAGRNWRALAELAIAEFGPNEENVMKESFEITVAQFAGVARRHGKATEKLWPEQDVEGVMETEDRVGGWRFKEEASDGAFGLDDDATEAAREERRRWSASEWLTAKTRSSFGKALHRALNDRDYLGPDGNYYRMGQRIGAVPARYLVTRVTAAR